jgi:ubiquitin C
VDVLVDEHQNMLKRLLDQEKRITDLHHGNWNLREDQFDLRRRIDTLERNVTVRTSPSPLRGGMQIFVKTLTGKTITISDIEDSDSVATLKELVLNKAKIIMQPKDIKLIFGGKQLKDDMTIGDYNIHSGNTIFFRNSAAAGDSRTGASAAAAAAPPPAGPCEENSPP